MQKRQQQTFETQAKDNMKNDVKKCAFRQTQRCTKHQCKDDVDWINHCTTIGEKSNTENPRKTRWDSRVQGWKNCRKTIMGKLAYPGLYNYKSTANQPWMPPPEQVCTDRQTTQEHNASSPIYWMGAYTRLPSVGFWSWSRFLAISLQVKWVIHPAVGCHYFPLGPQLPSQPLILLLGEQRHDGCEQFA